MANPKRNPLYGQNKADGAIQDGKVHTIVTEVDRTLTAAETGAVVLVQAAAISITLPAAAAGLNFKIVLGVETTAGADLLCASGDCFFGIVSLYGSDTADQTGVQQQITHATAIAAPGSYDTMDFVAATATLGGVAGDVINVVAVDDVAWLATCDLHTTANDPGTVAVIIAS